MQKTLPIFAVACILGFSAQTYAGLKAVATSPGLAGIGSLGTNFTSSGGVLNLTQPINAQTVSSYAILSSDGGKLITFNSASSVGVSLSAATSSGFTSGFSFGIQNKGATVVTITPSTSTINGASSFVVLPNQGCQITSDGSNYQVSACTSVVTSGTFSSRPACSTPATGMRYYATDLGTGISIECNGSKWKPVGGRATIYFDYAYSSFSSAAGVEGNAKIYAVPANLVSATGGLYIYGQGKFTNGGTPGTKSFSWRLSNSSGDVSSGFQVLNQNFGGNSSTLSLNAAKYIFADNSQTTLFSNSTGSGGYGSATSGSDIGISSGITLSSASYIMLNITDTTSSDTVGYRGVAIDWIEN